MRAFLLAGGRGTRLLPYTTIIPKPLMPVGDLPVMEILLRQLAQHGIGDVILSVGHLAGLIEAYFGDGSRFGLRLQYQREEEPLGTAGPLRHVSTGPDEALLVLNGDLLTDLDFQAFIAQFHSSGAAMQVGTYRRAEQLELGVLEIGPDNVVQSYAEKPVRTYDVSMGVYAIARSVIELIPKTGPFDMPTLVVAALSYGHRVLSYHHEGFWLDIGRPDDHRRAVDLMVANRDRFFSPVNSVGT